MENKKRDKQLKIAGTILISVVAVSVILLLSVQFFIKGQGKFNQPSSTVGSSQQDTNKLHLYQDAANTSFTQEDGSKISLSELNGKVIVLVYWTSWCPYCHTALEGIDELKRQAEEHGAILYLVNKLDGKKETEEKAKKYLADHSITTVSLYDKDVVAYHELGLAMVPTMLVIDPQGQVSDFTEGTVPKLEVLLSMISQAQTGKAVSMQEFIQTNMLNNQGGMRSNYSHEHTTTPSGDDVLSESQGLMMLSALNDNNADLFKKLWLYAKTNTAGGGLSAWVITKDGPAKVTAAVDDLRIYRALFAGHEKWGGYEDEISAYAKSLLQYNTDGEKLLDFYDFGKNEHAQRLTLCYADFEALKSLEKSDAKWQAVYNHSMKIVEGGVISESFPLYHSWYDYASQSYHSETLNMSEAMLTLLNLSRVNKLPPAALQWLRDRLTEGAIYSLYGTDGRPALNGRYESTAVYALCALVALSEGDKSMAADAVSHMESLRIHNSTSEFDGVFGREDGSGIFSFDQCTALLAYQEMERLS